MRFYRTVSVVEYGDLRATGRLRPRGGAEGKDVWEAHRDAATFGVKTEGHYHPGGYRVVAIDVPSDVAAALHRWDRLDGVGPARFIPAADLIRCSVVFLDVP